ncbi:cellulase family glycosylhydrolase [Cryptosporangium arvum]|uniref:cellulase family glycosylhydrolase n=1 Tax=Cryptosporangium arvum TaxID=80871 RepID=UPI0004B6D7E7|nr:cellulase family glycosylhydrolase [Cryptosporangium arvum]
MNRRSLLGAAAVTVPVVVGAAIVGESVGSDLPAPVREEAGSQALVVPAANPAPPVVGAQFHGTWEMYWNGLTPNAMFTRHLDTLAAQGVQMIRTDVGWSSAQPTNAAPDPNQWYHKRLATVIDAVRARGMQIFLTVHQSPAWSRPGTGSEVKQYPADPNSIKPWLTFVAQTYGAKIAAIEVWNEPNLSEFVGISDAYQRAVKYVPLLKASYAAIKAGRSTVPVIFGGPSQTDDGFIRDCYALGAGGYFDIMGVHPYQGNQTKPPESTDITGKARMTNMPAIINLMAANGDGAKPIWWTEFGFSVHSNATVPAGQVWLFGVPDDATAASYLSRSFYLAWQQWPQVKLGVVYCAYKTPSDSYGHQYGFRMIEPDGTAKPQLHALAAIRQAFGSLQRL